MVGFDRFQVGSGCFKCVQCGKLTRECGQTAGLCQYCDETGQIENMVADGQDADEIKKELSRLEKSNVVKNRKVEFEEFKKEILKELKEER